MIADYHVGHPAILPRPLFVGFAVEQGGTGAGTVIWVDMKIMGQQQTFRALERWLVARLLRPVYARELDQLEAVALRSVSSSEFGRPQGLSR